MISQAVSYPLNSPKHKLTADRMFSSIREFGFKIPELAEWRSR
jgi:hypothetical protein